MHYHEWALVITNDCAWCEVFESDQKWWKMMSNYCAWRPTVHAILITSDHAWPRMTTSEEKNQRRVWSPAAMIWRSKCTKNKFSRTVQSSRMKFTTAHETSHHLARNPLVISHVLFCMSHVPLTHLMDAHAPPEGVSHLALDESKGRGCAIGLQGICQGWGPVGSRSGTLEERWQKVGGDRRGMGWRRKGWGRKG